LLENPKFSVAIDDGRRWLRRHPDRKFDAIVMNTTWNWRAHTTNLLSIEFMQIAHAHLSPGGIFYFNTTDSNDVKKTALSVFPFGLRVYNVLAVSDLPLTFGATKWQTLLLQYSIDGLPILNPTSESFAALMSYGATIDGPPMEEGLERGESVRSAVRSARIVTDDNMATEIVEPLRRPPPM